MAVDVLHGPPLEGSVANVQRRRAFSVAALIIFLFAFWLGVQAPIGIMSATDELLTAERTREMLMTEPLVVHFNFERSFEKPPLQDLAHQPNSSAISKSRGSSPRLAALLRCADTAGCWLARPFA